MSRPDEGGTTTGEDGGWDNWKPTIVDLESKTLYVDKVENMPDKFIMGMDASCVPSLEASGVKYYDYDGTEKDVYQILSENGYLTIDNYLDFPKVVEPLLKLI